MGCSAGRAAAKPGHRALLASDPRRGTGAAVSGFGASGSAQRPAQHGEAQRGGTHAVAGRPASGAIAARSQGGGGLTPGSPAGRFGVADHSGLVGRHGVGRDAGGTAAARSATPAAPWRGHAGAAAQQFAPVVSFPRWRLEEPPKKPNRSRSAKSQARPLWYLHAVIRRPRPSCFCTMGSSLGSMLCLGLQGARPRACAGGKCILEPRSAVSFQQPV